MWTVSGRRQDRTEAEGQRFEVMGQPGEVLRFEPERALEWEWGGERFRFELSPDGRQAIAEQFGTS